MSTEPCIRTGGAAMVRVARALSTSIVILGLCFGALACSSDSSGGNSVAVTLGDFSIKPAPTSVAAGDVTFKIHNAGTFVHEFVVVRAPDLASIPVKSDGEANEDAIPESNHLGEKEDIQPGKTEELKLKLSAGKYVLLCNRLDGSISHFQRGMHTTFTAS